MARPTDWSALDRSEDPVPGDHYRVKQEATYYEGLATIISDQIDKLRKVADGDASLKGDYSDALRDSCEELSEDRGKAKGRFSTVSTELGAIVGPLDTALRRTATALDDAEDARRDMRLAEQAGYDPDSSEDDPELADEKRRWRNANDRLSAAKSTCSDAVEDYRGVVEGAARRIREAADDDLKDGRFEGFKAWVKAHADILREISKWLGRIVLVLAVVILLVSNPAGWLIAVALIAGAALLAVDTALAIAGEGSWFDVALDVVGLATLGLGPALGSLARLGRTGTLFKAGVSTGRTSAATALRAAFNGRGLFAPLRNVVTALRPGTYTNALRAGIRQFTTVMRTPLDDAAVNLANLPRILMSGRGNVSLADDLANITRTFPQVTPTALHTTAVQASHVNSQVASVALYLDNVTDEGGNFEVPVLTDLNQMLDNITTVEIPSL